MNHKYKKLFLPGLFLTFFLLYSFSIIFIWWPQYQIIGQFIFNWPDANANYFFAKNFAENYSLISPEPLNAVTDNLLHTRSINVFANNLVPMTFLPNIVIFGIAYKLLGSLGVLFLVPLLAILSAYLFYSLLKIVFNKHLATIALLLLLPLAPWLYFANLAMLTNMLLICLFLLALYFWAKERYYVSALFLGLALICRPSESIFLFLPFAFLFYWQNPQQRRHWPWSLAIIFILLLVFFSLNYSVYGHWLTAGYFNLQTQSVPTEFLGQENNFQQWLKMLVAPFGLNFSLIIYNVSKYFAQIFLPYLILAALAIFYSIKRSADSLKWQRYLFIAVLNSLVLILYYASWNLADPVVKNLNVLSSSYVRYFLPLYILWLPLSALALVDIFAKKYWPYFIVVLLGTISIYNAFWAKPDGLLAHKYYLGQYFEQFQAVKKIAPKQAVIVCEREDKIFFPYYRVVVPQGDLPTWPRLEKIVDQAPLYYFTNRSVEDLAVEQIYAKANNLQLVNPIEISGGFRLYEIQLLNNKK